jgi:hypothetical protein
MKRIELHAKYLIVVFTLALFSFSCNRSEIVIDDASGILGKSNVPVSVKMELSKKQIKAAKETCLGLFTGGIEKENIIPVQVEETMNGAISKITFRFPMGEPGIRKFMLVESQTPFTQKMNVTIDSETQQLLINEDEKKVLQYNYQTVYQKDVIRPESKKNTKLVYSNMSGVYYDEYLKAHPELKKDNTTTSSIYSVPRSNYIHPLYGLEGEMLTRDWPDGGHPHHRGIFWAWPEVKYGTLLGDIYALQKVFARPSGNIKFESGPVYAEINAENLWVWDGKDTIVNEQATIRVYRSTTDTRIIDLTIKLLALKDSVTIATRFTNSYGGLNLRMQTPEKQTISYFTDKPNTEPLRAWSDFNGIFEGNKSTSGLMILQNKENPEYPGEWRDYPGLAWVQPTFPTPETRYSISKTEPLVLRYRLVIHAGAKPSETVSKRNWDAYHSSQSPL